MADRSDEQQSTSQCSVSGTVQAPRRAFLCGALAAGIGLSAVRARADDDKPGADEKPQEGDHFVYAEGDNTNKPIPLADFKLGAPPVQAWPMDPKTKVVRDANRLNQVMIIRLDPKELDDDTRERAADGIVAYSSVCAHAGCIVSMWVEEQGRKNFKCPCHDSVYDPRHGADVILGPAPRHLAGLPVKVDGGVLVVAGGFVGKLGGNTG